MKKKMIFLFLLCLLILPISNVYASKHCNTSLGYSSNISVDDHVSDAAYRIYSYYQNTTTYGYITEYCGFENTVANNYSTSECSKIADTNGREICMYQKLCDLYEKSPYYDHSNYCEEHNGGSILKNSREKEDEAKAQEAEYDYMRDRVCTAAMLYAYDIQVAMYNAQVSGCKSELKKNKCKTEEACKPLACKLSKEKDSGYCAGTTPAETTVDTWKSTYGKTDKDLGLDKKYTGGGSGTSGTIADDIENIEDLTPENCYGFGDVVYYATLIFKIIQIAAPIMLIIWSSIDLLKSVMANDEKKILEMRKPIIHRFIAAACIFLVPWIVSTIVSSFTSNASWLTCWKNNRFNYSFKRTVTETDEEPQDSTQQDTVE